MPTPQEPLPEQLRQPGPAARLYRHACQEALTVALIWVVCLLWVVGYCYLWGYAHPADSWLVRWGLAAGPDHAFVTWWGIPRWVVVGILLPWLLASLVTILFAVYGMPDDELGSEGGESA